jgi:hypothetical protein
MQKSLFCSKCGAADQSGDSYCRQCGEWISSASGSRRSSREGRIRSIKMLQIIGIALSFLSGAIIVAFLRGGDASLLQLAAVCAFLVAIYQTVAFFIGNKVLLPKNNNNGEETGTRDIETAESRNVLPAADTNEFGVPGSVTENTTELLNTVPRHKAPNRSN